jgi:hypothetical protein
MKRGQSQAGPCAAAVGRDGGGQAGVRQTKSSGKAEEAGSCACEHVFVSIKGSAYARFRRALETNSASLATAAAYELPQLNLADALRLCLVYARADRSRFDRAIVRWHAHCLEAKGLDLAAAQIALAATTGLAGPHRQRSALLLAAIADDHQLSEVALVLEEWTHRGDRQRPASAPPPIGGGA